MTRITLLSINRDCVHRCYNYNLPENNKYLEDNLCSDLHNILDPIKQAIAENIKNEISKR